MPCGSFQHRADFILVFCSGVDGLRLYFVSFLPALFFSFISCTHSLFLPICSKGSEDFNQSCQACSLTKTVCVFCGLASGSLFLRRMQSVLSIWKSLRKWDVWSSLNKLIWLKQPPPEFLSLERCGSATLCDCAVQWALSEPMVFWKCQACCACMHGQQHVLMPCRSAVTERTELGCLALPATGRNDVVLYSWGFRHYWSVSLIHAWLPGSCGNCFALKASLR